MAVLYSNTIDRGDFHHPSAYENFKKKLHLENINFPFRKKDIIKFFQHNKSLNISIRLYNFSKISSNKLQIFDCEEIIGSGKKRINILFYNIYNNNKTFNFYFWVRNVNNARDITKQKKLNFVSIKCYRRFSKTGFKKTFTYL